MQIIVLIFNYYVNRDTKKKIYIYIRKFQNLHTEYFIIDYHSISRTIYDIFVQINM